MNLSTAGGFYRVENIIFCAAQTATGQKRAWVHGNFVLGLGKT